MCTRSGVPAPRIESRTAIGQARAAGCVIRTPAREALEGQSAHGNRRNVSSGQPEVRPIKPQGRRGSKVGFSEIAAAGAGASQHSGELLSLLKEWNSHRVREYHVLRGRCGPFAINGTESSATTTTTMTTTTTTEEFLYRALRFENRESTVSESSCSRYFQGTYSSPPSRFRGFLLLINRLNILLALPRQKHAPRSARLRASYVSGVEPITEGILAKLNSLRPQLQ
jgi:hypothetical protein